MELVKNIFFNTDRLTAGNTVKISYIGKFFQDSSEKVFMKYTFGDTWEEFTENEMIKTELGYQTEIELQDKGTFRFCLKNDKDEWDNNNGNDYVFEVEHPEMSLVVIEKHKPARKLRKSYIWSKKMRLAIYKLLITIPKIITGNYKKKNEDNSI